jgi:hypothetical protein
MRRLAVLLLVLLVVPALALAADTDPKRKINPADERRAASIVFKRTDFTAGWKKTTSPNDDDDLMCAYYNPNGSDLTLTGDAEAEFERDGGLASLYSYADVYATAKDAAASWTRTVKPAAVRCFAELFQREAVKDPSTKVTVQKQGSIAFPKVAPRTAAFRIALKLSLTQSGQTTAIPLTLHLVVVGRGRAEAGFLTFAPSPGVGLADLRAFAKLMAERMKVAGF